MLSELYSPDDVHTFPAISGTNEEHGSEKGRENYDVEANSASYLSENCEGQDTTISLKVQDFGVATVVLSSTSRKLSQTYCFVAAEQSQISCTPLFRLLTINLERPETIMQIVHVWHAFWFNRVHM